MQEPIIVVKNNNYCISYSSSRQPYIECDLDNCGCRVSTFIWVSHELKCIYFETPKAACTSIKKVLNITPDIYDVARSSMKIKLRCKNNLDLSHLLKEDDEEFSRVLCDVNNQSNMVSHKEKLFGMYQGGADDVIRHFPNYFSFMFVRDPFSRVVSLWQMFCHSNNVFREKQFSKICGESRNGYTFDQFIEIIVNNKNHHWNPYEIFYPKKYNIDFVGKLESMSNDWEFVIKKLGLESDLPHENMSKTNTNIRVSEKSLDMIYKKYAKDYKLFEYEI